MTTIHIAQKFGLVREKLATAFRDAGYEVCTYAADTVSPLQAAFLASKEPVILVTGQIGESSVAFGNHAALAAKMSDQPSLTFVYSSMLPEEGDTYLNNTEKDTVVLKPKRYLPDDVSDMSAHIQRFVNTYAMK